MKDALYLLGILLLAALMYADRVYWHSPMSYEHYGAMTGCHLDQQPITDENTGNVTSHFKCKEGEITLTLNLKDLGL